MSPDISFLSPSFSKSTLIKRINADHTSLLLVWGENKVGREREKEEWWGVGGKRKSEKEGDAKEGREGKWDNDGKIIDEGEGDEGKQHKMYYVVQENEWYKHNN